MFTSVVAAAFWMAPWDVANCLGRLEPRIDEPEAALTGEPVGAI